MLPIIFVAALTAATPAAPVPDATRLSTGTWCYALTASKDGAAQTVGHTFQSIGRTTHAGKSALEIVVHQRMGAKFDMRDVFIVDASTLRPYELTNTRFGKPHVHDVYAGTTVTETRWDATGKQTTTTKRLAAHAWDGNLYGPLFASMPLRQGDTYALPYYQYDKGEGTFTIQVTGERDVDTALGKRHAIVLQAGPDAGHRMEYLVGADPRMELAYGAGPFGQALEASCEAYEAAKVP